MNSGEESASAAHSCSSKAPESVCFVLADARARDRVRLAYLPEIAVGETGVDRLGGDEQARAPAHETPRKLEALRELVRARPVSRSHAVAFRGLMAVHRLAELGERSGERAAVLHYVAGVEKPDRRVDVLHRVLELLSRVV